MATKPTVIANQKPREVRLDQAGRRASRPMGEEATGDVRQVGTSNTEMPALKQNKPESGPMVVRPSTKLKVAPPPPEVLAAMAKAKERAAAPTTPVAPPLTTSGLDFGARLEKLKELNADLKRQMRPLETKSGTAKAAAPSAQSRIKAMLARRQTQ